MAREVDLGSIVGPQGETGPTGPKGETGATGQRGSRWTSGTAITGTSATATAFSGSGIIDALVNDSYLNTDTGNTYRCTVEGNAATAKWVYTGNIKGVKGDTGAKGEKGDTGAKGEKGDTGAKGDKGDTGETGPQGVQGPKGEKGDAFAIAKTFASVSAMNAGFATDGVKEGQFVIIDTGNVDDEDNAKLYVNFKLKQTIVCNKTKIIKNTCCFCWCRCIISQTSTVCCLTIQQLHYIQENPIYISTLFKFHTQ